MFVHLEGGWLSHPFPLSSFCIASEEQLLTLRGLGLKHINWAPDKSLGLDGSPKAGDLPASTSTAPVLPSAADMQKAAQRQALAAQRAATQVCERQYAEAAKAWRAGSDSLALHPEDSRRSAEALVGALLNKLLAADEVAIRLVSGGGADRAAAHALNVSVVSLLMGRSLGLADEDMLDLGVGALMHDIGKLDVADRLRHVEDGFSTTELNAYRDHVAKGIAQGKRMALAPGALAVLAQHHEHADGSGFPARLGSDRLSTAARIVAIVNRYDNLCNPGARVPALTPHEAVSTLFAQSRSRFDAAVLGAFIRMMGVYPAGSLVQLTDDRFALVVGVNSSRPLKPRVLVHDPRVPRAEALLLNLEQVPDLGIRRSLVAAKLPAPALQYLDPRPRVAYYFEALVQPSADEALAA
jgi:HD-GYP domain-containing protein (c-di-GMP phosphodiesterase class II)